MNKLKTIKKIITTQQERIKKKLEEILILIYRFRFLTRPQIQILLNHKNHAKVLKWLKYLTINKYIKRDYSKKFAGVPAVYSLGTNGRKYFKDFPQIQDINIPLLDRVWDENSYSQKFKKHCILLADIYISLLNLVKTVDKGKGKLYFFTKVDLKGVPYLLNREPDAYFVIEDKDKNSQKYFLEIIDEFAPKKRWQFRVNQYFEYFNTGIWQTNMKLPFPEIIIVCPNGYYKNKVKEFVKDKLNEINSVINFYLITNGEIKYQGINGQVLYKVEIEE